MTISIPVPPEVEARLQQLAREAGKDVASYVTELIERATAGVPQGGSSVAEFDRALDELFAADEEDRP